MIDDDDKAGSKEETGGETSRTGCSHQERIGSSPGPCILGPLSLLFFLFSGGEGDYACFFRPKSIRINGRFGRDWNNPRMGCMHRVFVDLVVDLSCS